MAQTQQMYAYCFPVADNNLFLTEMKKNKPIHQSVSQIYSMDKKIEEYKNQNIIQKLGELKKIYPCYRQIRGDGNCFMRSAFFLFFERLIAEKDYKEQLQAILRLIQDKSETQTNMKKICYGIPEQLAKYIDKCDLYFKCGMQYLMQWSGQSVELASQKLAELINDSEAFDFSTQIFMRFLAYQQFEQQKKNYEGFAVGNELKMILKYGEESEGIVISIIADALQVNLMVQTLNSAKNEISPQQFVSDIAPSVLKLKRLTYNQLHLFYIPGHYNIFYELQFLQANFPNWKQLSQKPDNQNQQQTNLQSSRSTIGYGDQQTNQNQINSQNMNYSQGIVDKFVKQIYETASKYKNLQIQKQTDQNLPNNLKMILDMFDYVAQIADTLKGIINEEKVKSQQQLARIKQLEDAATKSNEQTAPVRALYDQMVVKYDALEQFKVSLVHLLGNKVGQPNQPNQAQPHPIYGELDQLTQAIIQLVKEEQQRITYQQFIEQLIIKGQNAILSRGEQLNLTEYQRQNCLEGQLKIILDFYENLIADHTNLKVNPIAPMQNLQQIQSASMQTLSRIPIEQSQMHFSPQAFQESKLSSQILKKSEELMQERLSEWKDEIRKEMEIKLTQNLNEQMAKFQAQINQQIQENVDAKALSLQQMQFNQGYQINSAALKSQIQMSHNYKNEFSDLNQIEKENEKKKKYKKSDDLKIDQQGVILHQVQGHQPQDQGLLDKDQLALNQDLLSPRSDEQTLKLREFVQTHQITCIEMMAPNLLNPGNAELVDQAKPITDKQLDVGEVLKLDKSLNSLLMSNVQTQVGQKPEQLSNMQELAGNILSEQPQIEQNNPVLVSQPQALADTDKRPATEEEAKNLAMTQARLEVVPQNAHLEGANVTTYQTVDMHNKLNENGSHQMLAQAKSADQEELKDFGVEQESIFSTRTQLGMTQEMGMSEIFQTTKMGKMTRAMANTMLNQNKLIANETQHQGQFIADQNSYQQERKMSFELKQLIKH